MPIITFVPSGKKIEVPVGTLLFDAAISAGLPVASSCNKEFVCSRCNMKVLQGAEGLSPQSEAERQLLTRNRKPNAERISCQTQILGDCTVTTTYW